MPVPVTIGVAIRFEQANKLHRFLLELAAAARQLDRLTETEVVFCLNGANEVTRDYVDGRAEALDHFELPFKCIESQPGKIKAHEMVAKRRHLGGYLLFLDADVQFGSDLLIHLYKALEENKEAWACCADVQALPSIAKGWFRLLQNSYYRHRQRLPPRRHLHGRCFMMRQWLDAFSAVPAIGSLSNDANIAHLALQKGPLIDDIHYSRVLVHRFGPNAIAQVPDARVRFVPPESPDELYRDSFRTEFELVRLGRLFPDHCELEQHFFANPAWLRCLSAIPKASLMAAGYLAIESGMRAVARHRIVHLCASPRQWQGRGQNHHTI